MRAFRSAARWLAPLWLAACVPTLRDDVHRVQELARVPLALDDYDRAPDLAPGERVRAALLDALDVDAAVRIALLNNRALRAELRELGVARGRLVQAGLLPNPRVEAELLPERNTAVELRVEYDLRGLLLAPLQARAAEPDLEAARCNAAASVLALGFEVRAAYYALQAAEAQLATGQRALDASAASRDFARALVDAGNLPPLDAAAQEAAYQEARVAVADLELAALDRREALQRLLGLHGDETRWRTRGALAEVPEALTLPDRAESIALNASLEAAAMRARLESAGRRAGLARVAGALPELTADLHVLAGDPSQAASDRWGVGAGVSLALPIFDRQQGRVREYAAEFDAGVERYVGLALVLRSEVREARNHLASAHARARQYDAVINPARARVTEQTVLQYNAMRVGVLQLLEARRAQLAAELATLELRREYWTARAAFDALLAGGRASAHSEDTARRGGGR